MTPLSMTLGGGALGVGIGMLCGCPDRAFKYGIVGLFAGNLIAKLTQKSSGTAVSGCSSCGGPSADYMTGLQCPEGFDLVSSNHQIACAYRGQAACLAGTTDERGQWQCTARDFECPPGMFTRKGAPANWCFPA